MMYVTFKWNELGGVHSKAKAIECPTEEDMRECVADICSLAGIVNIRINKCGRLPKYTKIIPWKVYKKDNTWIDNY